MALGSADGVRSLFMWHALEETEHKSVVFDVYRAIGGDERLRIRVIRAITVGFVVTMLLNVAISLALDPAARDSAVCDRASVSSATRRSSLAGCAGVGGLQPARVPSRRP